MSIRQTIAIWEKKGNKHVYLIFFVVVLLIAVSSGIYTLVAAASTTNGYVDPKLGFGLQVPTSWSAHAYPGSSSSATTSGVMFSITSSSQDQIGITVIRDTDNVQNFWDRGTPTLYLGNYPAFDYDTPAQAQYPLACTIRVMLAGNDLVTGSWCSPLQENQAQVFANVLASYVPVSNAQPSVLHANIVNAVESCQKVITSNNLKSQGGNWGKQLGNPTDPQWTANFSSGAAICDNFITSTNAYSGYLFQCVELANRFAREQWGIAPGFTVIASQYFDYVQNGTFYPGQARTLYGNNVQLSNDASQGTSSFAPVAGDLLVWQDVKNRGVGWTSGLDSNAGHVAIITGVDATHVYIAQQNYSATEYYATLALTRVANGWAISGLPFRDTGAITRGWIHFSANPHPISFLKGGTSSDDNDSSTAVGTNKTGLLEAFARAGNNTIDHVWQTWQGPWGNWTALQAGKTFQGDPTVTSNAAGGLEVFARGIDNNIDYMWQTTPGASWDSAGWVPLELNYSFQGTPTVAKDANGLLEVFARGSDNNIWYTTQQGTGWSGWSILQSSVSYFSSPKVMANQDGLLEVFALGSDNNIWHISQESPTVWSSWGTLQTGLQFQGTPTIAMNADGRLEVFVRGSDNSIRHAWQTVAGGTWSGWAALAGGETVGGNPSVSTNTDGRLELFVRGTGGDIYHLWQNKGGPAWQGVWVVLQSNLVFKGTPSEALNADGRMEIFAIGSNNNIWHAWQKIASGSWSSWVMVNANNSFSY